MSSIQRLGADRGTFRRRQTVLSVLCVWLGIFGSMGADLFDDQLIPDIRIEVPEAGVDVLRAYRWKWGGNDQERTNVLATVYEGKTIYTNVAVHLKGSAGSFRPFDDRPALTLNFGKDGSRQRFHGLEKLHLNNSVQDPSYISEVLARELCASAGLPVTRAGHCVVTLNGRSLGLYVLVEGWTKAALKKHFGDSKGKLFDGGFAHDIDEDLLINSGERSPDATELKSLLTATRIPDPKQRLDQLRQVLDIDRFQTLMAIEVLLAHWDGYCIGRNNYRIYQNPSSSRLVFLPHGMDQLFGVYRSTPEFTIHPRFKSIVAQSITSTRDGRSNYLNRLTAVYTNHFLEGKLSSRVDEIASRLTPLLQTTSRRSRPWSNAVTDLKNRIERRVASVGDQIAHPRQPLAFGENRVAVLKAWVFKTDSSGEASGERSLEDGRYLLKIHGGEGQSRTWASWRHTELLDEGVYELRARVRLVPGNTPETTSAPEIAVRLSGERGQFPRATGSEWQELVHTFEVSGPTEVEMLCELRGTTRTALLDATALRLIKRPLAPQPR